MTRRSNPTPCLRDPIAGFGHAALATMLFSGASLLSPPMATAGQTALTVSGTVEYTGSHGPISAQTPILLFLLSSPTLDGIAVDTAVVDTNGGSFELAASQPGLHYLVYLVDTNGDALPAVGDPFQLYDGFLNPPQTDLALTFDDSNELPGIQGAVTYTGALGPVAADHPIRVDVYRQGDLTERLFQRQVLTNNGDHYEYFLLDSPSRLFFLRAYVDLNDNDTVDEGEPFTIYNQRTAPFGDPLPQGAANLDISFGDEVLPTPTPGNPATLSGTVEYTGEEGPVSAERPIVLLLLPGPNFGTEQPLDFASVDTNGGAFELTAPAAGEYYLGYLLNTSGDGPPSVGDPFEVYLDRVAPPPDPVTLPQSGLALSFGDTGRLPGIAGTATYTGSLGPVGATRPIVVHVFRDAALTDRVAEIDFVIENGGAFDFVLLDGVEHFLMAFLDLNQDQERDPGEPFTIYDGRTSPPGDPIPEDMSRVDISFGDEGVPTPTATPTPTQTTTAPEQTPTATPEPPTATPTPETSCVGDCDRNGVVTLNELVLGTTIALGQEGVGACPAFDPQGSGTVTVARLVAGVKNSLDECPGSGGAGGVRRLVSRR